MLSLGLSPGGGVEEEGGVKGFGMAAVGAGGVVEGAIA